MEYFKGSLGYHKGFLGFLGGVLGILMSPVSPCHAKGAKRNFDLVGALNTMRLFLTKTILIKIYSRLVDNMYTIQGFEHQRRVKPPNGGLYPIGIFSIQSYHLKTCAWSKVLKSTGSKFQWCSVYIYTSC